MLASNAEITNFDRSRHNPGCTPSHCACSGQPAFLPAQAEESSCGCCHGEAEESNWLKSILIPAVIFIPSLLAWYLIAGSHPYLYVPLIASYLLCGWPVLLDAWAAIRRRDFFNEFTLMSVATLAAIGLGQMLEAVGVMLFYAIGEKVQDLASGRSRRSIAALIASKPESANLVESGSITTVNPEDVAIGSSILIRPGERVPLDGVVRAGDSDLDLSSLTGESIPIHVGIGDKVYGGSICLDGSLTLETSALFADSMVGRILALVEGAMGRKSRTERFVTAFARKYTPLVTLLAVLVAVVPPLLFQAAWNVWIYRALALLVISCPCALVLSVPLAFFGGIGAAAKFGLIVKGGQVFDALLKAKTVIFDKTGTLTQGAFSLADIIPAPGVRREELLRLAALAESLSNHPLAKSIVKAAKLDSRVDTKITVKELPGLGLEATTPEGKIVAGNARLMREQGLPVAENSGAAVSVHVAKDGVYQGCILVADSIKKDSRYVASLLKDEVGITQVAMLTGDSRHAGEAVAAELGFDSFEAELLPGGKVDAYHRLSPDGSAVFVGDGVNDAPVLATAGVGVAMGGLGSNAAMEIADAVILDDSPYKIGLLFKIAGRTRSIAWQNIIFAMSVKILFISLSIAGLSGLWEAVFADVGVALLSVLNALRVSHLK